MTMTDTATTPKRRYRSCPRRGGFGGEDIALIGAIAAASVCSTDAFVIPSHASSLIGASTSSSLRRRRHPIVVPLTIDGSGRDAGASINFGSNMGSAGFGRNEMVGGFGGARTFQEELPPVDEDPPPPLFFDNAEDQIFVDSVVDRVIEEALENFIATEGARVVCAAADVEVQDGVAGDPDDSIQTVIERAEEEAVIVEGGNILPPLESLEVRGAEDFGSEDSIQTVFERAEEEAVVVESGDSDKVEDNDTIDVPSVRQILQFAVSAIGVWLCSPILSMIDTSAVGLLAGTAQQAALNPAVSVTDYGGLLVAFMYTATTNLVAAAQQTDRSDPSKPLTARTLTSALRLGLLVGLGFGLIVSLSGRHLLRALIGNDAIDPAVFAAALRYVRIRSLGMPAAVVIGTAQSACLGMQDLKSPLLVLLAAAVINFFGDAVLVRSPNLWIGGAAGAAWATVFSQYAALAMFIRWFQTKPGATSRRRLAVARAARAAKVMDRGAEGDDGTSLAAEKEGDSEAPPSRGFLKGRFSVLDLFRLPKADIAREFLPYVGPVTTTSIGRISGFLAMSHVASSALGTVDMAAQQIILSFFCCLCPVSDSLNLTAQSFIPPIFARKNLRERADAMRRALGSFIRAGGIIGAALVAMVSMIPLLGQLFTTDPAVIAQVNAAVPGLAAFFGMSGIVCVGEGMFLGQRDLAFLGNAYAAFFFAVPAVLLRLKRRALAGVQYVGVGTMWSTFAIYQIVRFAIWVQRMKWLQGQREADAQMEEAVSP